MTGPLGPPRVTVTGRLVRYDGERVIPAGTCSVQVCRCGDGWVLLPYGIAALEAQQCPHGVLISVADGHTIAAALGQVAS